MSDTASAAALVANRSSVHFKQCLVPVHVGFVILARLEEENVQACVRNAIKLLCEVIGSQKQSGAAIPEDIGYFISRKTR